MACTSLLPIRELLFTSSYVESRVLLLGNDVLRPFHRDDIHLGAQYQPLLTLILVELLHGCVATIKEQHACFLARANLIIKFFAL